jgi:hypothetical protein
MRYLIGEVVAGIRSGIPWHCVLQYVVIFRLHVLLRTVKVLVLFYPDGWEFFQKNQYHRCLWCHSQNLVSRVLWNGVHEWNFV